MAIGPLDRVEVDTASPDRQIRATLSRRDQVELRFRPRAYPRYSEEELGHQLSQLATLTWVEYQRRYFAAFSEETGTTVRGDERSYGPKMVKYREALAAVTAHGRSSGGWVEITSTGLVRWRVSVRAGACARLNEDQFIAEAGGALRSLLADYYEQQRNLQVSLLGMRRPDHDDQR